MDSTILEPLAELVGEGAMVARAEEVVRTFFSSSTVTVNLIPALLAGIGAVLFLLPLLGIPILDIIFGAMTGTSTSGAGYGSSVSYGGSGGGSSYSGGVDSSYAAPSTGYGAYSARSGQGVELTPEQAALFPELAQLREQIDGLQESEKSLREQIFFNTAASEGILGANQISYTY